MVGFIVGVDVGGTFTDAAAVDLGDGRVYTAKARSTPHDLISGLMSALELLADQASLSLHQLLSSTVKFAHGTTQTSNVIFTWRGAKTGLLTTRGFADEILIMRARGRVAGVSLSGRRHLRATSKPPQIVPRSRIEELNERVDHHGRVLVPLREADVVACVERLLAQDVESLAVSLLWAPENPEHELAVEDIVRDRWPTLHVSLSHRLAPVLGEYERTSTTVVNAWVAPTVERYLTTLTGTLNEAGLECPVLIVQASGGVVQAEDTVPVHTVESGPAAGMIAVKALAEATNETRIIATDVGGTTFKVGLLIDGDFSPARETIVNQYSIQIPMIDIISIGAGGGSIAWVDDGRLRIGPDSAGADPGPACYGWGGTQPTITDADVVLGFIDPDSFLGGRMRLSTAAAKTAIEDHIARRLYSGDAVEAAAAVKRIVDAQMGDLIRKATIEHGHDPRGFVLAAYGGAGPLHAADYARGLGISKIIVPVGATAFSALGAAASDIKTTRRRSVRPDLLDAPDRLELAFVELEHEAAELIDRQQVPSEGTQLTRWVDMRYERQLHDVHVVLRGRVVSRTALHDAFEQRYEILYGSSARLANVPVQLLRVGVDAIASIQKPPVVRREPTEQGVVASGERPVYWPGAAAWVGTAIYDGTLLSSGQHLQGPAIIEVPGASIAVPDDASARVDSLGHVVITLEAVA